MSNIIKKAYPMLNMQRTGCIANVERAVKKLHGITDASVNPNDNILSVTYDADRLTPGEIRAALLSAGYDFAVKDESESERAQTHQNSAYHLLKRQVKGAWVLTIPLLLLAFFSPHMPYAGVVQLVLALIVVAFFGNSFYINAWHQARLGRCNMDTLVVLTASAAFFFSAFNTLWPRFWQEEGLKPPVYYGVAALIVSLILTGRLMEKHAQGHVSTAIRQLRGLQPEVVRYLPEARRIDDRIAGGFVLIALCLSAVTFLLWLFFTESILAFYGLYAATSVLVMMCPCALGLSTPIALIAGIRKAADNHILIKDAIALEQMSRVDVVVFDKTGTLTEGRPTITGWLWAQNQEEPFKNILLAAELNSSHPLANAIVEAMEQEHVSPVKLDSCENIHGKGIQATYQGQTYWVGSHKLLKDFRANASDALAELLVQYESDGNSIVYFGRANQLLAIIAIKDQIKATSRETVRDLRIHNIDVCMLTGDGQRTASAVASCLGIAHFVADARSDDKRNFVRELQLQGKIVAMVGDGVNDSQALACADVSIAMARGTDTAMDVAMVTLATSDLLLLPKAFRISYQTVKLMNSNLLWAFIYIIVCIPIAAGVFYPIYDIMLSPFVVYAAISLSCISVLLNSLKT